MFCAIFIYCKIFQLPKCQSAQQCGDIQKHAEEKQEITKAGDLVKSLERDIKSKITIIESKQKLKDSVSGTFDEGIRCALINSNKSKYLFKNSQNIFVPKTAIIQIDSAILARHYNNKIPEGLQLHSEFFQEIIDNFNDKSKSTNVHAVNPIKRKLEHLGIQFPSSAAGSAQATQNVPPVTYPLVTQQQPDHTIGRPTNPYVTIDAPLPMGPYMYVPKCTVQPIKKSKTSDGNNDK